jgi:hypothetical protein
MFDSNNESRIATLAAFNIDTGYFYNEKPYRYNGFIDGMAWVSILAAAANRVGDTELAEKSRVYVQRIIDVGKDARTYAPFQVDSDWKQSSAIPGYWYLEKPQENAGPLALKFAMDSGVNFNVPDYLKKKIDSALRLRYLGIPFGIAAKYVGGVRQHIDSMFLSYLAAREKPAFTMKWLCEENPLFSYVFKKRCFVAYPKDRRYVNGESKEESIIVPFAEAKPSIWPFRRDPYSRYFDASGTGTLTEDSYTPIYKVVGDYLQSLL